MNGATVVKDTDKYPTVKYLLVKILGNTYWRSQALKSLVSSYETLRHQS